MRISELSDSSGVAVATIKYYAREGLLPAGERTSHTQTSYDDGHLARLKLIRALIDAGGLSVAATRRVLDAIDDQSLPLDWTFGVAQQAVPSTLSTAPAEEGPGRAAVDRLVAERGWKVFDDNPGRAIAANVIDSFHAVGREDLLSLLPSYAAAADLVASADLSAVQAAPTRERMTETVVVGTVLGDALLAGLRRIAQENLSHTLFPAPDGTQHAPDGTPPQEGHRS